MIGLMVTQIEEVIDDTQHDVVPFDSSGGLGLFSLYPPNIPGQFTDIVFPPAQVGVNRPMLFTSAKGLRVLVQAYLNMAQDDTIHLYRDDTLVDTAVLPADHGNLDVVMHIPADKVLPGVHTLRYEIARKSGQGPEGAQLEVWFKIDPPGGIDPEPDMPGHQRLKPAQLPFKDGDVIDKDAAANGFIATVYPWLFMTEGDTLKLFFHGVEVAPYTVKASDVGNAISVLVTKENIEHAGPANPAVVVYQIKDQVENVSDFSERATVISDPENVWPDPVIVPLADGDKVSLDQVGLDDLQVQIITRFGFALKEKLLLRWTATTQSGVVVEHSEEQTITRLGIQSFEVPNRIVKDSAPGQVRVDYLYTKADGKVYRSQVYIFALLGETLRLPAPQIPDLVGGTLDPALSQTTVFCGPDDRIKKGFRVTLTWVGTTASGHSHHYQTYRDVSDRLVHQPVPFIVAAEHIRLLDRGSVSVSYQVSHATLNPALDSKTADAHVRALEPVLPAPKVSFSSGGVLNPADVPHGTGIQVPAAAFTRLDDTVHVEGLVGKVVFRDKLQIDHTRVRQDLDFWLDSETVNSWRDRVFSLHWWIERSGVRPQLSAALQLYIGDPTSLQPPIVHRAPEGVLDPLENNEGVRARIHITNPRPGDLVRLVVKGAPGEGSPTFEPQPLNADNFAVFSLPPSFIAHNLGKQVELRSELIRDGNAIQSTPLILQVKTITDMDPALTRPQIVEAGAVPLIDLRIIKTDLTCVVKPPLPIAVPGQPVWLTVTSEGVAPLPLRAGIALTAEEITQGISVKADRSWFYALKDLSTCELTCKIALRSTDTEDTALKLPVVKYTVKVTEALAINTATMLLNGVKLVGGTAYGLREREVVNNVQVRVPTGGRTPYTYQSANAGVATVDANGKVAGMRNGSTTITVMDADQQKVSYSVQVTNVYRLVLGTAFLSVAEAHSWLSQSGATRYNNNQPFGAVHLHANFVDLTPLFDARGAYYGRFVAINLSFATPYVVYYELLDNGVLAGASCSVADNTTRKRWMAYHLT